MACRLKRKQDWYRNKMRKECSAEWLSDQGRQNNRKISWSEKGDDESKSLVMCLWAGNTASRKPSSFAEFGPTGAERVNAVPALMEGGERQLVGAGLGTGLQGPLHPPPLGLLEHCLAEQLLCSGCQNNLWKSSPRSSRDFHSGLRKASEGRLRNCTFHGRCNIYQSISVPGPQDSLS